jgi:hypothetical protein
VKGFGQDHSRMLVIKSVLFCFSLLHFRSLRARIVLFVIEWRREVHTGTQPEWICVQHGLILSHELIGTAIVSGRSIRRWIVSRHVVRTRGHRLRCEARDIRGIHRAIVIIVNEIGLCVVLLFWPWSARLHSKATNPQEVNAKEMLT